ncbi:MAG: CPXCG motif-containing cysteine-rich protein [Gemmatimonadota bacterium]|nr:CPXCG motif-containing cysteine-rich protein [Gemmatimonadota bacterium]
MTADVQCPACGEIVEIVLDPHGGSSQEYVEDCEVCCRPWSLRVSFREDMASVEVELAS